MPARSSEAINESTASVKSAIAVDVSATDSMFAGITRGVYVGASGNLAVQFVGDNGPVTLVGLAAGVWHPMQVQKILNANTTATGIVVGF